MKKKGFTLIELLAVIVILAIIALISTPLVLKYIEKSRKESKVDSAYSFVRNLETEIANYSIKNKGSKFNKVPKNADYYELTDFEEDKKIDTTVKGDKPDNIKVCLSSLGQVDKGIFVYGKYYVSYDGKKGSITDEDTYTSFSCSSVDKIEVPEATKNLTVQMTANAMFFNEMRISKSDFNEEPIDGQDITAVLKFRDNITQEIILKDKGSWWGWEQEFNGVRVSIEFYDSASDSDYYNFDIHTYDSEVGQSFEELYSVTLFGNEVEHYLMKLILYTTDTTIFNRPEDLEGKRLILTFEDNSQKEINLNESFNIGNYDNGSVENYTDTKKNISPYEVIYYYAEEGNLGFGIYGEEREIKTITTDDNGVMTTYNIIK